VKTYFIAYTISLLYIAKFPDHWCCKCFVCFYDSISLLYEFLILLPLDVCDILVAEQPFSEEWHTVIRVGSCLDLSDEDYDHGILCAILYVFILLEIHHIFIITNEF
jgi:hypothetical protein